MGGMFSLRRQRRQQAQPRLSPRQELEEPSTPSSQLHRDSELLWHHHSMFADPLMSLTSPFWTCVWHRHGDPRIDDLVVELKAVNWHQLGLQLQVPPDKLDKIDEDYRSSDRKLSEVLQYWLLNDLHPSWDKICDALRRIGGFGRVVRELRMKYCSLKTCRQQHAHGKHDQEYTSERDTLKCRSFLAQLGARMRNLRPCDNGKFPFSLICEDSQYALVQCNTNVTEKILF